MLELRPILYDGTDKTVYRTWSFGGGEGTNPFPVSHTFSFYDEMYVDNDVTRAAKVKPCVHTTVNYRPVAITGTFPEPSHPLGGGWETHLQGYLAQLTPADIVNDTILPKLPLSLLSNEGMKALNRHIAQVETSMSAANSFFELKDFGSMFMSIFKQVGKLKQKIGSEGFASLFKSPPPKYVSTKDGKGVKKLGRFRAPTIYDAETVAHKANGQFLQWQFAIKPLIQDIQTLQSLSREVEEAYNKLVALNGLDLSLKYRSQNFCDTATPSAFRLDYHWPSGGITNNEFRLTSYTNEYVATQRRIRKLDIPPKQEALLKIALAMAGLNNPMAILWEGVPLSFVVDFILPVGNLLQLGAVPPFVATKDRSYDLTWSIKENWTFECFSWMPFGPQENERHSGDLLVERYDRRVGPYVVAFPLSTFTISERMLVLSLLSEKVQVYRNRTNKRK